MKRKTIFATIILILIMLTGSFVCGCSKKEVQQPIGIIGAMEEEVSLLKASATITKTTEIADMEFCEGTIDGKAVIIVQCGMGKVNAGICANVRRAFL